MAGSYGAVTRRAVRWYERDVRAIPGRWAPEPVATDDRRVPLPWLMAVLPLVTFGFGSAAPFFYAGVRTGRRRLTVVAGLYLLVLVAWVVYMAGGREDAWHAVTGVGALFALGCVATAHAFAVRRPSGWGSALVGLRPRDPVTAGRARMDRRRQARRIADDDPELADELRIGRPDLRRTFDDGGLVDVNHVPAVTLAAVPGITTEMAAEIVAARERIGGFDAVDDLGVLLDVAPATLDRVRDVLICRR
jgi:hypothetical protein